MKIMEKIVDAEGATDVRKKYLDTLEKNPEIGEYNNWRREEALKLGILIGFLLSVLGVELILIGILLGDIL